MELLNITWILCIVILAQPTECVIVPLTVGGGRTDEKSERRASSGHSSLGTRVIGPSSGAFQSPAAENPPGDISAAEDPSSECGGKAPWRVSRHDNLPSSPSMVSRNEVWKAEGVSTFSVGVLFRGTWYSQFYGIIKACRGDALHAGPSDTLLECVRILLCTEEAGAVEGLGGGAKNVPHSLACRPWRVWRMLTAIIEDCSSIKELHQCCDVSCTKTAAKQIFMVDGLRC